MRGHSIPCPACGESLKVPAKSQVTSHRSGGNAKHWLIAIAVLGVCVVAGLFIHAFLQHREQAQSQPVRIARRERPATVVDAGGQTVPRPRYSFLTNEMWLKPVNGDLDGVKEILDKDPKRLEERVGGMRATLLHIAAFGGQPEVVAELLRRGAEVNLKTTQGHTPLYDCIGGRRPSVEIVKMLLDAKADLTIADNNGKTPLQLAVEKDRTDIADLLRQSGATK